jgi:hypothetical protein
MRPANLPTTTSGRFAIKRLDAHNRNKKYKIYPRKAHENPEGYIYSYFNLGTRWGWVANATPWWFYSRETDPV